jgi:hypothetical protein
MPIGDVIVDGRRINIMTTEGADAFINDGPCLYFRAPLPFVSPQLEPFWQKIPLETKPNGDKSLNT